MAQLYSWKEKISKHDLIIDGVLTHPFESIHLGNGDIGASVNIYPHEIKIILAKSDVWDARFDGQPETDVLKHDDLIALMKEQNRDLKNIWEVRNGEKADYYVDRLASLGHPHTQGPCLKRVGCIRLYHPGLSNTKVTTRVRLTDGVLESRFVFPKGELIVSAFVEKDENRFWMQVKSVGETPWFVIVAEKEPDETDPDMPKPLVFRENGNIATLGQTIPEGFDIDEFNWFLSSSFPVRAEGVDAGYVEQHAWRFRQYCSLKSGKSTIFCVGIATDRDGSGDTRKRAVELASANESFEQILEKHKQNWEEFWEKSNISLDDDELESVWYRNHFSYGCAMSRSMTPLGSGGNVAVKDYLPWHGDCHTNHNFQKWYCTALPTNHAEWIDVYADFIEAKMPVFEAQARLIFGLEGAYCDLSYLPIMANHRYNINNSIGRALAVTGWMGQQLWWHWEYMRDKEWLRNRAYPYLKKAAEFYYNYLEKYSNESGEIYPSIRIEEPGWMKDFKGNRNVISDLCMFKKAFDRAIEASVVLDTDADWREKWTSARAKVPAIEHGIDENGEGWVALDKDWGKEEPRKRADEARYSRWGGGGWIVYPGEYIQSDGNDSLTLAMRDMIRRTDLADPFISSVSGENIYPGVPVIHPISSIIPAVRLGVTEHYETIRKVLLDHRLTYGQTSSYKLASGDIPKEVNSASGYLWYDWRSVENKYAGVLAVTEMLLQSQGGIIRLFPFFPKDNNIAFQNLRAIGGFGISAERKNGKIRAEIESFAGETVRMKWSETIDVTCNGVNVEVSYQDSQVCFNTKKGKTYICTSK